MNRKNLTAAVLAGLAGAAGIVGSAQAVNINPDGLGQVLIYPYYTTNGGNHTILSVVNTTGYAKAVKVRFLEGMNSREVLDFNLYLSAYDVWVAAVLDVNGTPTIEVPDKSCTVPYIHAFTDSQQAFLTFALTDGGPATAARTAEGHFEMIEMGTLTNASANNSATAVTHVNGTPPVTTNAATGVASVCGQLVGAWSTSPTGTPGYWLANRNTDLTTHSGGLFGGAGIINVAEGSLYAYDAIALNDWTRSLWTDGPSTQIIPIHQNPGNVLPSLGSGDQRVGTIFLSTPVAGAIALSNTGAFTRGIDAVSYTFMQDTLMNEYGTEASLLGKTEWVVTFPTKNFYVHPAVSGSSTPLAPFTTLWDEDTATACELVGLSIWDREEQVEEGVSVGPIVSPPPPDPTDPQVELCYETNVVQFDSSVAPSLANPTGLLGSSNGISINNTALGFETGWMRMTFAQPAHLGGLHGLPVTGFRLSEFTNQNSAPGIKATYGGLWQHKYTRMCSAGNERGVGAGCNYPSGN